jgi:hypothetical protein
MKNTCHNEVSPAGQATSTSLQSCRKLLEAIEQAKKTIVSEFHATKESHQKLFKQALNEAEALAWQTEYPHLLFPWLAMEKVQAVAHWQSRQQAVYENFRTFAEAA